MMPHRLIWSAARPWRESNLTISIEEFRSWLKVPEDAYSDWKDLKRNVVLPAVDEINAHGEEGGFFVGYEGGP
jgi:hypothetical protein